ncbi:hypothetical protein ACFU44_11970 [Nocardia rhizosphaerihabitans]|uniref:hypothetical protein n=1 Tax=Nocardia rhizosphaerihabitans TaxID=1691570 RepID=UPI00367083DC
MAINDSATWRRHSHRIAGQMPDPIWHEELSDSLEHQVREWLGAHLMDARKRQQLAARLNFTPNGDFWYLKAKGVPRHDLLDWLDAALDVIASYPRRYSIELDMDVDSVKQLDAVLRDGHSVWKVGSTGDALVRRQDPTATAAVRQAVESAGADNRNAVATHLQAAWNAAYGLRSDPSVAYREAILAVEAASIPVVVPHQVGATLGHVLGQLDRQGHLYRIGINDRSGVSAPASAVVAMIRLLWEGHTDRHEGVTPAIPITLEAAQMASTLAVTLVQWFTTGAIQRR